MSLGDKTLQAIQEIKQILEKHGKNGWLPVKECEKLFVKLNPQEKPETRHRRFYRLIKKIKEGKINELQHVEIGKKAWIGLKEADPSTLKAKPSLIRQYLIKRFWQEEREIEEEWHYGNYLTAYKKAMALAMKLWEPYREKLIEEIGSIGEKLKARINSASKIVKNRHKIRKIGREYLEVEGMPQLIKVISQVLHEIEKELPTKNE